MTAVERLEIRMAKHYDFDDLDRYLFEQAKEMEKEQIKEAFLNGADLQSDQTNPFSVSAFDAEQYYNETFKSE